MCAAFEVRTSAVYSLRRRTSHSVAAGSDESDCLQDSFVWDLWTIELWVEDA